MAKNKLLINIFDNNVRYLIMWSIIIIGAVFINKVFKRSRTIEFTQLPPLLKIHARDHFIFAIKIYIQLVPMLILILPNQPEKMILVCFRLTQECQHTLFLFTWLEMNYSWHSLGDPKLFWINQYDAVKKHVNIFLQ